MQKQCFYSKHVFIWNSCILTFFKPIGLSEQYKPNSTAEEEHWTQAKERKIEAERFCIVGPPEGTQRNQTVGFSGVGIPETVPSSRRLFPLLSLGKTRILAAGRKDSLLTMLTVGQFYKAASGPSSIQILNCLYLYTRTLT